MCCVLVTAALTAVYCIAVIWVELLSGGNYNYQVTTCNVVTVEFLVHDTFARTNRRAIAMTFVCLSVWDGRAL